MRKVSHPSAVLLLIVLLVSWIRSTRIRSYLTELLGGIEHRVGLYEFDSVSASAVAGSDRFIFASVDERFRQMSSLRVV